MQNQEIMITQCKAPAIGDIKKHLKEFLIWKNVEDGMERRFKEGSNYMNINIEVKKENLRCYLPIYYIKEKESEKIHWIRNTKLQENVFIQKRKSNSEEMIQSESAREN